MNTYMYLEVGKLLSDKFAEKKKRNPSFSIRSWASQMGLKSHGALQQMLAGKRPVPKKYIPVMSKSLDLTVGETMYFETLIDFEKAKGQEEKDVYYERLNHLRPQKREVKVLEIENYKYFQNPLHSIIRTLIEREDFKNDLSWIQEVLRFKATQKEISQAIERLIALNLLEEKNGELKKVHKAVQNQFDIPSSAVQEFHKKMSLVASEEVSLQDVTEREFSSFCFNIKKNQFKKAKEALRELTQNFISEFEAGPNTSNETFHLNVQLFSLTKNLKS